jgi:hypothetical protein
MNIINAKEGIGDYASFAVSKYTTCAWVENSNNKVGAYMQLYCMPKSTVGKASDRVVFIQACRARRRKTLMSAWEVYYTGADREVAIIDDDGWWIDAAGKKSPVFGLVRSDDNGSFSQDLLRGIKETDTNKFGRWGSPAVLYDRPGRTRDGVYEVEHEFESVAIIAEGSQKGMRLGSVTWGYQWEARRNVVSLLPLGFADAPSNAWDKCVQWWNDVCFAKKRIPVPDEQ